MNSDCTDIKMIFVRNLVAKLTPQEKGESAR